MTDSLDAIRARHVHVAHDCAAQDGNFPPYRTFMPDESCDTAIVLAALDAALARERRLREALKVLQDNWPKTVPAPMDAALAETPEAGS